MSFFLVCCTSTIVDRTGERYFIQSIYCCCKRWYSLVLFAVHCNSKLKVNNCKVISITEVQEVRISGTVLK